MKSYKNLDFLNSPDARLIRILSEMIEPSVRFRKNHVRDTVVFFGSARFMSEKEAREKLRKAESKIDSKKKISAKVRADYDEAARNVMLSRYYEDAVKLSEKLTKWFKSVKKKNKHLCICSGGGPGIMEAANRGAHKAGGKSVGLNISLPLEQYPNPFQTKEISFEFHYFFIRKFWFFYLAKALVIFPGGFGTMDELFELLTLIQTRKTKKHMPVVIYDSKYWDEVINFAAYEKWGTISKEDLKLFRICNSVDEAFEYLKKEITKYHL